MQQRPLLDVDTVLNRVVLYADNDFYSIVSMEVVPELQNNPVSKSTSTRDFTTYVLVSRTHIWPSTGTSTTNLRL